MSFAARYLTHFADWGIVSAMSPEFGHQPFGTLQSFADGLIENSTGTPYFYIARISDTAKVRIFVNRTVGFFLLIITFWRCKPHHSVWKKLENNTCRSAYVIFMVRCMTWLLLIKVSHQYVFTSFCYIFSKWNKYIVVNQAHTITEWKLRQIKRFTAYFFVYSTPTACIAWLMVCNSHTIYL